MLLFTPMLPSLSLRMNPMATRKVFGERGGGESPGGLFQSTSLMILSGTHFFLGLQFLRTTATATKQKENTTDQTHHRIRTRLPEASPDFVCVGGEWLPGTSRNSNHLCSFV